MEILPLRLHPELAAQAAEWFHQKWGVPAEDYRQSIDACLQGRGAVPQWYLARENGQIAGGVGVIENDFHDRKDLSPNVCALYVEEPFRGQGLAGRLLLMVCAEMAALGAIPFISSPTIHSFMNGTAGTTCAWCRETTASPPGCTPAGSDDKTGPVL